MLILRPVPKLPPSVNAEVPQGTSINTVPSKMPYDLGPENLRKYGKIFFETEFEIDHVKTVHQYQNGGSLSSTEIEYAVDSNKSYPWYEVCPAYSNNDIWLLVESHQLTACSLYSNYNNSGYMLPSSITTTQNSIYVYFKS